MRRGQQEERQKKKMHSATASLPPKLYTACTILYALWNKGEGFLQCSEWRAHIALGVNVESLLCGGRELRVAVRARPHRCPAHPRRRCRCGRRRALPSRRRREHL